MTETPTKTHEDIQLTIDSRGGIPLNMAGFLLRAIGTAYPGTKMETTDFGSSIGRPVLSLRIPYEDFLDFSELGEDTLESLAPDKDDPELIAFTSGLGKQGLRMAPPPWLAALLLTTAELAEQAIADDGAPNYMSVELLPQDGGEPFTWIICRRGRPSPHVLRKAAEDRVAVLEQQLRGLGIEPTEAQGPPRGSATAGEEGLCAAASMTDPNEPCPNVLDPRSDDLCTTHYERENA